LSNVTARSHEKNTVERNLKKKKKKKEIQERRPLETAEEGERGAEQAKI